MRKIEMFAEHKVGNERVQDGGVCTEPATVYKYLAGMLTEIRRNHVAYPARLARVNNYDGTQTLIIAQSHGYRWVFTIPDGI